MPSRRAMSAAHENAALSRKVSKSGDTARRRSVITDVSARTDSWSSSVASAPSGRIAHSSWSRSSGSPARTSTRDRRATLSSNQRPTGTIWRSSTPCAFAPSAIRAAPVRIGARRGMSCVVPSGKTAIVPPSLEVGLGVLEGAAVRFPCSPVDLPVDRDHAGEREEGPHQDRPSRASPSPGTAAAVRARRRRARGRRSR